MSKTGWISFLIFIGFIGSGQLQASSDYFDFLDPIDQQPLKWVPESTDDSEESSQEIKANLSSFYEEFAQDGNISIYIGYGYEAYFPERAAQIYEMIKVLASHYKINLMNWSFKKDQGSIQFYDPVRKLTYSIKVGSHRNNYIQAFSKYEVVMYHGHSRYGRGPAFGAFENYFRMGRNYSAIEVDTRNPYFQNEPILKTDLYPILSTTLDGELYLYQYRGQKDKLSKLPQNSYTKNIPGKDVDLVNASFLPGRQIFYFYSCKNRKYWRESLRDLFPNSNEKFVIGTYKNGYGSTKPEAVMIMSLVRQLSNSADVVKDLNSSDDCRNCFTTY